MTTSTEQRVQTSSDTHASSTRDYLYLFGILLVGAFFRFFHIGAKPLWQDEAWTWQFTRLNWWPDLLRFLAAHEINMSPYHLLLKGWITMFGDGETALRSLSAIAAVLTIPVVYAIGKRLFNSHVGLLAAFLFSLNAFHIRYSQEARGYSLAVLLVSLAVLLYLKAIDRSSLTLWIAQAFLLALATYIHMFAVLVAIALWIASGGPLKPGFGLSGSRECGGPLKPGFGLSGKENDMDGAPHLPDLGRGGKKNVVFSIALYVILCFPLAYFAHLQGSARLDWIQPMSWKSIAIFLKLFCGNSGFPLAAVIAICVVSALIYAIRAHRRQTQEAWPYTFLFLWLFIPITAAAIVSIRRPVFVPRYLLICLPALVLLISAALMSWRSRVWKAVFLAALLVMSFRGIFAYYHKDFDVPRADWPTATRYIFDQAQRGDAIATRGSNSDLDYYSRNLPAANHFTIYAQEGQSERPSARALESYPRVWCVLQNRDYGLSDYEQQQNQQLASDCGQGRAVSSVHEFRGLHIVLYERR